MKGADVQLMREFVNRDQMGVMLAATRGEEGAHFVGLIEDWAARIRAMPKTYDTREQRDDELTFHLHYFVGGCDWWIAEKDVGTPEEPGQHQAYGLADIGQGGEMGYISIVELNDNRVDFDLYWKPCTLAELRRKRSAAREPLAA